ncbi:hypothetical protein L7F22_037689 [Adiantum nelumboides]|nr:hypothetical protein [Adiantum nelumboides]
MEDGARSSCEDTGPLVFTDFASFRGGGAASMSTWQAAAGMTYPLTTVHIVDTPWKEESSGSNQGDQSYELSMQAQMKILDQEARAIARLQDFFRLKSLDPEEALAMHSPSYDAAFHQFLCQQE